MTQIPNIETAVYGQMLWAAERISKTAGIGAIRGPYGVGKTHAIEQLQTKLTNKNRSVITVTGNSTINGNMLGFANEIISRYGMYESRLLPAAQSLADILYDSYKSETLLIVDEAQGLRVSVLETLRSIWDKGDRARDGFGHIGRKNNGRPFGLMLCGNSRFLDRDGRVQRMDMLPLFDRISLELTLEPATDDELRDMASKLLPDDPDAAEVLAKLGLMRGNLRSMVVALRQAIGLADGSPVTKSHIQDSITMIGGI